MRCLTSSRFNMLADIVKPVGAPVIIDGENTGSWEYRQNEDSGAIENFWVPDDVNTITDETYDGQIIHNVNMMARGIINGGLRAAGTTEDFGNIYQNIDWLRANFPANTNITKRDQVTNIRSQKSGEVIWKSPEMDGNPPITFNVMGVTPIPNPFGVTTELLVLLQRAEVQENA